MQGQASNENLIEGSIENSLLVGVTPEITIGTVTTLEPGEKVKVELDETSTKFKPVLNFAIPKGKKGDKGDKGDTGEDAYTAAQNGGYVGTQDEFYQSLASIGNLNAVLEAINGESV